MESTKVKHAPTAELELAIRQLQAAYARDQEVIRAAKKLLQSIDDEQELGHLANYTEGFNEAIDRLTAALAKAESSR